MGPLPISNSKKEGEFRPTYIEPAGLDCPVKKGAKNVSDRTIKRIWTTVHTRYCDYNITISLARGSSAIRQPKIVCDFTHKLFMADTACDVLVSVRIN